MRHKTFQLLFLSMASALPTMAGQTVSAATPTIVGPEYLDSVEAVADGKRVNLEKQSIEVKVKINAFGYGGATNFLQIAGERSPTRFQRNQKLQFVIRTSQAVDPTTLIKFYHLDSKNGFRRVKTMRAAFLGSTTDKSADQKVPFSAEKFGTEFFKFQADAPLQIGEYLIQSEGMTGFLFGID